MVKKNIENESSHSNGTNISKTEWWQKKVHGKQNNNSHKTFPNNIPFYTHWIETINLIFGKLIDIDNGDHT